MLPSVADVLALPNLRRGRPLVRAGRAHLDRAVRWVHVAEVADIAHLLGGGELILTTGIALPDTADGLHRYVGELRDVGASALVIELVRRYGDALPDDLVAAAQQAGLPLIELHRETRFVAITQEVHTLILNARDREGLERQTHRTVLTALAMSTSPPATIAERARALGVDLDDAVTAVVVRPIDELPAAALLRDLGTHAVAILRSLGVPALVGPLDDHRVAVLLGPADPGAPTDPAAGPDDVEDVLRRFAERLHAGVARGPHGAVAIGAGTTGRGTVAARRSLREAIEVADTTRTLPADGSYHRPPDLRLRGLVHALREVPALAEFVARELDTLVAHDAARGTRHVEFLTTLCRSRGNKSAAAAELFISRAALYDRIAKVQDVLGVDLGDPEVLLSLHFALLARETLTHPDLAVG